MQLYDVKKKNPINTYFDYVLAGRCTSEVKKYCFANKFLWMKQEKNRGKRDEKKFNMYYVDKMKYTKYMQRSIKAQN